MLLLSSKDIESICSHDLIIDQIIKSYRMQYDAQVQIPERRHIDLERGSFLIMPAFSEYSFITKVVSVFPGQNPSVRGNLSLFDSKSGELKSVMDANKITEMRTAGIGALAARRLVSQSIDALGVFGAGVQALAQVKAIYHELKFRKLLICNRTVSRAEKLKSQLERELPQLEIIVLKSGRELVDQSQVIVTATASGIPLFEWDQHIAKDQLFISIGSFKKEMRELPDELLADCSNIFTDSSDAMDESGDLVVPLEKGMINRNNILLFNELLFGGYNPNNGLTVFKSVGNAIFDLCLAEALYELAMKRDIGHRK